MSILSLSSWFLEYMELVLLENKKYLQFTLQNITSQNIIYCPIHARNTVKENDLNEAKALNPPKSVFP